MDIELLRERARIIRDIRDFFDGRDYLETDTPLLAPDLIPESCLEVFETFLITPAGGCDGSRSEKKPLWLIPSPEIWMKRLIAKHKTSIYQICKSFRNVESTGNQHNFEFSMLEYYTVNADYKDSLAVTEELFAELGVCKELSPPFIRMTVGEAFLRWAGFDLYAASRDTMEEEARRLGLNPPGDLSVQALFDLIFIHAVEPNLRLERPIALLDYPAFVPCLAKKSPDGMVNERWELYVRGIELANCFTEETDREVVRAFFESEQKKKKESALVPHNIDKDYPGIFKDFPRCSGVAMGLDRLIMAMCKRSSIDSVLPFPPN